MDEARATWSQPIFRQRQASPTTATATLSLTALDSWNMTTKTSLSASRNRTLGRPNFYTTGECDAAYVGISVGNSLLGFLPAKTATPMMATWCFRKEIGRIFQP